MSPWKPLRWVGGSKKDLQLMPGSVQDVFGFALHLAQEGGRHSQTKAFKRFGGNAAVEIVEISTATLIEGSIPFGLAPLYMSSIVFRRSRRKALQQHSTIDN